MNSNKFSKEIYKDKNILLVIHGAVAIAMQFFFKKYQKMECY